MQSELYSESFQKKHCTRDKDFTRNRLLSFTCVVLILLNMLKKSLQDELDNFFQVMLDGKTPVREVTKSAFTQARKKLKYTAFVALNKTQIDHFYDHFEIRKWQGYRLLAIDGSMSDLPDTQPIRDEFGVWQPHSGGECPKARLSQLFDPLNEVTIDALIKPKSVGERAMAEEHLSHVGYKDLILMDRGYPAFWLFALILSRKADFCVRVDTCNWSAVKRFLTSGKDEVVIKLPPSENAKKVCKEKKLSTKPIKIRLVRIELESGSVEVLMTSLIDLERFPIELFKELYHQRWGVEEDYKLLKSRLEMENWTGKTVTSVYQDFHATMFTKNFAAMLAHPAQDEVEIKTVGLKYRYQINQTNLLSKLKNSILKLLSFIDPRDWLEALWDQMIRTREPIRPGRSFPRNKKVKRKRFSTNYKSTR